MSREIKFRVWNIEENEYKELRGCPTCGSEYYNIGDKDFAPEQYTGLKDKNGVEIYEGDIVRCTDTTFEYFPHPDDGGEIFVIKWWAEMGGFWLWHVDTKRWSEIDVNPFSYLDASDIEVIGNIQENPELLE